MTPASNAAAAIRLACRGGAHDGPTAGLAPGFMQANLVILPAALAREFRAFCALNPKPCPLLGMSEPGARAIPALGTDLDLATDLPRYRLWRDGVLIGERTDIADLWRDDLVAFAIGCSFSFEAALQAEGIAVAHIRQGRNVPMYRSAIACTPAGRFAGPMVVSMRPLRAADAIRAIEISAAMPEAHGAPVHLGDPALIGIADLARPDYGDAVAIGADEIPVFWACGVTPQAALAAARPDFAITHAPGCMLVTDRPSMPVAASAIAIGVAQGAGTG
ncbi:MAG: putative hydro-lyase [Rhodospirillales bacterium]|nr:putative hydro-lyase [Rhodospirillales bacterium]